MHLPRYEMDTEGTPQIKCTPKGTPASELKKKSFYFVTFMRVGIYSFSEK